MNRVANSPSQDDIDVVPLSKIFHSSRCKGSNFRKWSSSDQLYYYTGSSFSLRFHLLVQDRFPPFIQPLVLTVMHWGTPIRLHGRRGKGMAESFSRQKSRHAPQKEGGLKILCDLPPVWPRLVRPTNLMSRMDGNKTQNTHPTPRDPPPPELRDPPPCSTLGDTLHRGIPPGCTKSIHPYIILETLSRVLLFVVRMHLDY